MSHEVKGRLSLISGADSGHESTGRGNQIRHILSVVLVLNLAVIGVTEPMLLLTQGGPQDASRTIGLYTYQVALQFGDLRLGYASAMSLVLGLASALISLVIFRTLRET